MNFQLYFSTLTKFLSREEYSFTQQNWCTAGCNNSRADARCKPLCSQICYQQSVLFQIKLHCKSYILTSRENKSAPNTLFSLIQHKGFINRNLSNPISEAGHNFAIKFWDIVKDIKTSIEQVMNAWSERKRMKINCSSVKGGQKFHFLTGTLEMPRNGDYHPSCSICNAIFAMKFKPHKGNSLYFAACFPSLGQIVIHGVDKQ